MWLKPLPIRIEPAPDESLPGYILRFAQANAMTPKELGRAVRLQGGWLALATKPDLAPALAALTGLDEQHVRRWQIANDPFEPGRIMLDGQSLPIEAVSLALRRRPKLFDGVYRTNWLLAATASDDQGQPLESSCPCGRSRRWVDDLCCEMMARAR